MPKLQPFSAIEGAVGEKLLEVVLGRLGHSEGLVRTLGRCGIDLKPRPDDFDAIYVYTLVQYGDFKPRPILNFFRHKFVRNAFREAFYENDPDILAREAEGVIDWNEETGKLGRIDYNPRREFASFNAIFSEVVRRTRTPAEVQRDQKIHELHDALQHSTQQIVDSLDELATLDEIREQVAQLAWRPTWSSLLVSCQKQVAHAVAATGQRYIQDLYVEREVIEADFADFSQSDRPCMVVVGTSGSGKTNLVCHLANHYVQSRPVILLSGRDRIRKETDLVEHLNDALNHSLGLISGQRITLNDFVRIARERNHEGIVFIDGISENDDIVLMKRAVQALLTQYGGTSGFKLCLTCRDVLWYRFAVDFPRDYVYLSAETSTSANGYDLVGTWLGAWTNDEFEAALVRYQQHYVAQFSLAPSAAHRCKHPLMLRLLCEAYAGQNLGTFDELPTNRIFRDYLDRKTHVLADYFGLGVEPRGVMEFLLKLRATMWDQGDVDSLPKSDALNILSELGFANGLEVYTRLLDEGLLSEATGSTSNDTRVRFLFDELGDFLLYRHFVARTPSWQHPTQAAVLEICELLQSESFEDRKMSERFLELLARNLEEGELLKFLLDQVFGRDLYLFARCVEQRFPARILSDQPEERAGEFAYRLLDWYDRIVRAYFPRLQPAFDPYYHSNPDDRQLGVELVVSAEFREVNYRYRLRDATQERVQIKFVTEYPSFQVMFDEVEFHNPNHGMVLTNLRTEFEGTGVVYRILNFENNSPFPGVSLEAPDRIAKFDVWTEIVNVFKKSRLREPFPLVNERAVALAHDLGLDDTLLITSESIRQYRDGVLSAVPRESRQFVEMRDKLGELEYNLRLLNDNYDPDWLPGPDLSADLISATPSPWVSYSEEALREYLMALLRAFIRCYWILVDANLAEIGERMNVYQQYPVSVLAIVPHTRQYARMIFFPEMEMDDAIIQVSLLPPDVSVDAATSKIKRDGIEWEQFAEERLYRANRMSTSSHLIDRLLPMGELFGPLCLNNLTYNWLRSEVAEVLKIPYSWRRNETE